MTRTRIAALAAWLLCSLGMALAAPAMATHNTPATVPTQSAEVPVVGSPFQTQPPAPVSEIAPAGSGAVAVPAAPPSLALYRLGIGDRVRISVYEEQDLSLETRVPDGGVINYPFLGEITVLGLTSEQLERQITGGLRGDYLVDPLVTVTITAYRSFYVTGDVRRAGDYDYLPGMTVDKAISMAGGLNKEGGRERIYLIRDGSADRIPEKVTLDTIVLPGDVIEIKKWGSLF